MRCDQLPFRLNYENTYTRPWPNPSSHCAHVLPVETHALLALPHIQVLVRPTPLLVSQIADTPAAKTFKERVVTSGCCGIKELIKLEGLTLVSVRVFGAAFLAL
jgi:hypothetical protein